MMKFRPEVIFEKFGRIAGTNVLVAVNCEFNVALAEHYEEALDILAHYKDENENMEKMWKIANLRVDLCERINKGEIPLDVVESILN